MNAPDTSSTQAATATDPPGRLREHIITLIGAIVLLAYAIGDWASSGNAPPAAVSTALLVAVFNPAFNIWRYRRQARGAVKSTVASIVLPALVLGVLSAVGGCGTTRSHELGEIRINYGPPCVVEVYSDGHLLERAEFDRCTRRVSP